MQHAALGVSDRLDPADCAREAVDRACAGLGGASPEAAILVANAAAGRAGLETLLNRCGEALGGAVFAGGSSSGVMAGTHESEGKPALALLALSGVRAEGFLCEDLRGHEPDVADRLIAQLGGPPGATDLVVAFADSTRLDARLLVNGLGAALGGATLVGIGAEELPGAEAPLVWEEERAASAALSGLVLRLDDAPRIAVTNACTARSAVLEVTRSRGHWIQGLGGRPALEVYRESLPSALRDDLDRARTSFLLGVLPSEMPGPGEVPPEVGRLQLRVLIGHDAELGSIGVAEPLARGTRLVVVGLDAGVGRQRLLEDLGAAMGSGGSRFGIYCGCRSRGRALFGHEGLEGHYVARVAPGVPILGVSGPIQLAAGAVLGAQPRLLTHAGVLALAGGSD